MIEKADFADYHGLDHWPFTPACRQMPRGGGFYHLKLAWDYRRRDQLLKPWFLLRCRWGKHQDVLYSVGHNGGKMCWYCQRPGVLTPDDIAEMRRYWPRPIDLPGDEDT